MGHFSGCDSVDNKVFNNHNLLEKTLAAGLCLFSVSGDRSFPMHDYYRYVVLKNTAIVLLQPVWQLVDMEFNRG